MARRPNDGSGTVWVHDGPNPQPEPMEPASDVPAEPPPAAPAAPAAPQGLQPAYPAPEPASSSGMSTGCLVAMFALGGVAIGVAVLLVIGAAGAAFYFQGAPG